ncbi:MAG: phage shock protein A [Desulfobacterales bacterium]|nr:MAG: phage shock protein A [Desulfobacterales bacterium]
MTNIFIRINDIINANINDLLDKVEDPQQMIRQIVREMKENIREARERTLDAMAHEKELAKEAEEYRTRAGRWKNKAENALKGGNENLARKALACKKEYEQMAGDLEAALRAAQETTEGLKSQLWALEGKLEIAMRKQKSLAVRQRAAEARQFLGNGRRCYEKGLVADDKFSRMESRVRAIESMTEAIVELDNPTEALEKEFRKFETDADLEDELNTMKKELEATIE